MTQEYKAAVPDAIRRAMLLAAVCAACCAAAMLRDTANGVMELVSPLGEGAGMLRGAAIACAADFVMLLAVTAAARPAFAFVVSAVVMAARGAALGAACACCAVCAAPVAAAAITVCFALSTVLTLAYCIICGGSDSLRGGMPKPVMYFAATGAAALLRLLPLLFI